MLKAASAGLVEAAFFCDAQMLIADATTPDCSGAGGSAQHRSHEKLDLQAVAGIILILSSVVLLSKSE